MTLIKLIISSSILIVSLALAGCNTTKGFGQDLEKVGGQIEEAAEEKGADDD